MRTFVLVFLFALACPQLSAGQTQTAEAERAIKQGRTKVWVGVTLMAAGAIILPVTAASSDSAPRGTGVTVAIGLVGVGGAVTYAGFRQQQRAVTPSTSFGVALGKTKGVVVRRSW